MLADAASVRDLNRLYRGRDEETDVLSFAAREARRSWRRRTRRRPWARLSSACPSPKRRCATSREATVGGAVAHLLTHGLLHLLGYDHEDAADAASMQAREDVLLDDLGYAGQYAHGH